MVLLTLAVLLTDVVVLEMDVARGLTTYILTHINASSTRRSQSSSKCKLDYFSLWFWLAGPKPGGKMDTWER